MLSSLLCNVPISFASSKTFWKRDFFKYTTYFSGSKNWRFEACGVTAVLISACSVCVCYPLHVLGGSATVSCVQKEHNNIQVYVCIPPKSIAHLEKSTSIFTPICQVRPVILTHTESWQWGKCNNNPGNPGLRLKGSFLEPSTSM